MFGQLGAAILNAAVSARQAIFGLKFKVRGRTAAPYQKSVLLGDRAGLGLAHDRAVLHSPVSRIAVPAVQCFAVENRNETLRGDVSARAVAAAY